MYIKMFLQVVLSFYHCNDISITPQSSQSISHCLFLAHTNNSCKCNIPAFQILQKFLDIQEGPSITVAKIKPIYLDVHIYPFVPKSTKKSCMMYLHTEVVIMITFN